MNTMTINFSKYSDGLVPAIVQDANTKQVLMMGFMNQVVREGFLAPAQMDLVQFGSEVAPLLSQLVQAAGLSAAGHPERL